MRLAKPREARRFAATERLAPGPSLGRVLTWCRTVQATDRHAQADHFDAYRLDGQLRRILAGEFVAPSDDDLMKRLREAFSVSLYERSEKQFELDLSFMCRDIPYRAIFTEQQAVASNDRRLLAGIIKASASEGMHSFDQHLLQLLRNGRVTEAAARHAATNWNRLEMEMRGYARQMPGILKRDADRS